MTNSHDKYNKWKKTLLDFFFDQATVHSCKNQLKKKKSISITKMKSGRWLYTQQS